MHGVSLSVGRWLPFSALVLAIYIESGVPDLKFVPSATDDLLVRKLGHAAVFGLVAVVVRWALQPRGTHRGASEVVATAAGSARWIAAAREWLLPLLLTALVAAGDELLQSYAPGRQAKITDVATDMTGAVAFLVLLRSLRIRRAAGRPPTAATIDRSRPGRRHGRAPSPVEVEVEV